MKCRGQRYSDREKISSEIWKNSGHGVIMKIDLNNSKSRRMYRLKRICANAIPAHRVRINTGHTDRYSRKSGEATAWRNGKRKQRSITLPRSEN